MPIGVEPACRITATEGALEEDHHRALPLDRKLVAAERSFAGREQCHCAAMHPADQVEAFRRLADAGSTAAAIALPASGSTEC